MPVAWLLVASRGNRLGLFFLAPVEALDAVGVSPNMSLFFVGHHISGADYNVSWHIYKATLLFLSREEERASKWAVVTLAVTLPGACCLKEEHVLQLLRHGLL